MMVSNLYIADIDYESLDIFGVIGSCGDIEGRQRRSYRSVGLYVQADIVSGWMNSQPCCLTRAIMGSVICRK